MSLKIGHIIAPLTMYTKKEKRKTKLDGRTNKFVF